MNGRARRVAMTSLVVFALVVGITAVWAEARPPLYERVKAGAYVHLDGEPNRDPVTSEDLRQFESQTGKTLASASSARSSQTRPDGLKTRSKRDPSRD